MRNRFFAVLVALPLVAAVCAGSDHRDAPGVLNDPSTDICDVYAFVNPTDSTKVCLAMTVNGFSVPGNNSVFSNQCLYQFKIDNTGDFVEDLVIQVMFDEPTGPAFSPAQNFSVFGPAKPAKAGGVSSLVKLAKGAVPIKGPITNVPATGPNAGKAVNDFTTDGPTGIKVFCGLRDDAFTFDQIFIYNILRGTLAAPNPANTRNPGIDFYAKMNCSVIAIELNSSVLAGELTHPVSGRKQLNIWATTSIPSSIKNSLKAKSGAKPETSQAIAKTFIQKDRAAHPVTSTVLIADGERNGFNAGQPKDDAALYTTDAVEKIRKLQLDPDSVASGTARSNLLAIRFPDVLRLDVGSTSGFDAIDFSGSTPLDGNARRPQDDVISFELGLLTVGVVTNEGIPGSNGRVGGNDATFVGGSTTTIGTFPYFAPPHLPAQPVPARN